MFARYFVELPIAAEMVESTLALGPRSWMAELATHANLRGDSLLADVGFGNAVRVARKVVIEFRDLVKTSTTSVIPMRWTPMGAPGLFPSLDADIVVAGLGPGSTQLSISARYTPPFGMVGQTLDRALLHRVAEATLKDFLDRVADAISHQAAAASSTVLGEPS